MTNKSRNRASRILFDCPVCKISLCDHEQCWDRHINMIYKMVVEFGEDCDFDGVPRHLVPADGI